MLQSASRGGGFCLVWGVSAWSGGCLPGPEGCLPGQEGREVCLVPGGLPAWSQRGGSACLVPGGVCLPGPGGSGIPACTEADTLRPCGQTHTCKNITLATISLRPVTITMDMNNKICNTNRVKNFAIPD